MINIDMWYGDKKEDATRLDIFFNDLDCMYSGNIYKGSECIGDYYASSVQEIESEFKQLEYKEA